MAVFICLLTIDGWTSFVRRQRPSIVIMSTLIRKINLPTRKFSAIVNPAAISQPMLLRVMLWIVFVFVGIQGLSEWLTDPSDPGHWLDFLIISDMVVALLLLQKGYLKAASLYCVLSQLLLISGDITLSGNFNTFHVCTFALLIMLAGLLFERIVTMLVVAYCSLVTLLGYYLGVVEAGRESSFAQVFHVFTQSYVMLYIAVAIISNFFSERSRQMLQRLAEINIDLKGQVLQREQAEIQVRKLNDELEMRVRQRTAELSAANRELEAFAYSVSHDLRAPLRGIDGWSMALLEDFHDKLNDEGREYLTQVRKETQRMSELIDDILELSRITRSELRREPVDMSQMAQTLLNQITSRDQGRKADIVVQPDLRAVGDPHLLRQVLENLLSNAWKFTKNCDMARIEFGMYQNAFFVKDNGAGFDMAYANKLFSPFQRLHRVSEFPGTGVGLAIVQRVVRRHGGDVWADSKVNEGATFVFTLQP